MRTIHFRARTFALAVLAGLSCKDSTGSDAITSLLIVPNPVHLLQRDSVLLVASAQTSNGSTVPVSFTFTSTDTTIVTVTPAGRIRSKDAAGVGSVIVSGGGLTVPLAVTVAQRVTSLGVVPNPINLLRREGTLLSVTALDVINQPVPGVTFTYASSDTTIAKVFVTGLVTGRDSLGTAQITVTAGVVDTQVPVTVTTVPTGIQLSPTNPTLRQGDTVQFTARVVDQYALPAPAPPVTYQSGDSAKLTITPAGVATAVGAPGSVLVSAHSDALTAWATVVVIDSAIIARTTVGGDPYGAAISSTGVAYVTLPSYALLARTDLPSRAFPTRVGTGYIPTEVAFNSTGTRAYVANQGSHNVRIIDVASNTKIDSIPVTGDPFEVIVTAGDSILYVSTNVNRVYGIRLSTNAVVDSFATPALANGFVLRNDTLLYASTHGGSTVVEFNLRTRAVARTFAVGGTPQKMALSADGNELYIANQAGYVQFWDLVTGTQIGSNLVLPGSAGYGMARRPSTGLLYVTSAYFGTGDIHIIDPVSRTLVRTIVAGGSTRRVIFNASGSIGFVPNEGGWIDFLK